MHACMHVILAVCMRVLPFVAPMQQHGLDHLTCICGAAVLAHDHAIVSRHHVHMSAV